MIAGARELGLLGLSIPPEYGGLGLSVVQKTLVHEMLGRGPWGLASFISVHTGIGCVGIAALRHPGAEGALSAEDGERRVDRLVRARPSRSAGSDAGEPQDRAERDGDHWVLNGRKIFITNAPYAHHVMMFARTHAGHHGVHRRHRHAGRTDRPGLRHTGHRGSRSREVVFEDCRVPADRADRRGGQGFRHTPSAVSPRAARRSARAAVGAAQKAMELALEYGEQRHTFGKPLARSPGAGVPGRADERAHRGGALVVYRTAWLLDQGSPAIRESSTAKLFAAEGAWQTVDDAIQMFGGYGYIRDEYMIERIWRDVRVARVYDGSSEVQQIVIAQRLRKGDVESRW